jgi:hypothetical protein
MKDVDYQCAGVAVLVSLWRDLTAQAPTTKRSPFSLAWLRQAPYGCAQFSLGMTFNPGAFVDVIKCTYGHVQDCAPGGRRLASSVREGGVPSFH